jgi:hypothetical protein
VVPSFPYPVILPGPDTISTKPGLSETPQKQNSSLIPSLHSVVLFFLSPSYKGRSWPQAAANNSFNALSSAGELGEPRYQNMISAGTLGSANRDLTAVETNAWSPLGHSLSCMRWNEHQNGPSRVALSIAFCSSWLTGNSLEITILVGPRYRFGAPMTNLVLNVTNLGVVFNPSSLPELVDLDRSFERK